MTIPYGTGWALHHVMWQCQVLHACVLTGARSRAVPDALTGCDNKRIHHMPVKLAMLAARPLGRRVIGNGPRRCMYVRTTYRNSDGVKGTLLPVLGEYCNGDAFTANAGCA